MEDKKTVKDKDGKAEVQRILDSYTKLCEGRIINKEEAALCYGDSVTATGLTAVIHKRNIPTVWYGNVYYIAQKTRRDRKNWTEMPWFNGNAPDWWGTLIGMGFYPDGVPKEERWDGEWDMESDMQINWTDVYGSLEPGEYLLVKEVVDLDDCSAGRHIGARFTVEKG